MELNEQITVAKLDLLVREILGEDWSVSPLTEISKFIELKGFYNWNLYLYRLQFEKVIDKAHHRFAIYDYEIVDKTFEAQLRRILNQMKAGIEFKQAHHQYVFF